MRVFIHKICGNNKMKKRFLWITLFFIIGAIIVYFITDVKIEAWTYNLPNDYAIKKTSDTSVVLGKYIDGLFEVENDGKQIGIEEYIAEFSYSKNYIALKCLESTTDNIEVNFYIIDSKNENIYGPYKDEETYNKVEEKIVDEELNQWIETIKMPSGAINK